LHNTHTEKAQDIDFKLTLRPPHDAHLYDARAVKDLSRQFCAVRRMPHACGGSMQDLACTPQPSTPQLATFARTPRASTLDRWSKRARLKHASSVSHTLTCMEGLRVPQPRPKKSNGLAALSHSLSALTYPIRVQALPWLATAARRSACRQTCVTKRSTPFAVDHPPILPHPPLRNAGRGSPDAPRATRTPPL